jgi:hypothetical protein
MAPWALLPRSLITGLRRVRRYRAAGIVFTLPKPPLRLQKGGSDGLELLLYEQRRLRLLVAWRSSVVQALATLWVIALLKGWLRCFKTNWTSTAKEIQIFLCVSWGSLCYQVIWND